MGGKCSYCRLMEGNVQQLSGAPCSVFARETCCSVLNRSCRFGYQRTAGFTVSSPNGIADVLSSEVDGFFEAHAGCGFNYMGASDALKILQTIAPRNFGKRLLYLRIKTRTQTMRTTTTGIQHGCFLRK